MTSRSTTAAATLIAVSVHTNNALFHNASPKKNQPLRNHRRDPVRSKRISAHSPARVSRCWSATGPQSKTVVSKNVVSVARSAVAKAAAVVPATARVNQKRATMVITPTIRTGRRTDQGEGSQSFTIGLYNQLLSAPR